MVNMKREGILIKIPRKFKLKTFIAASESSEKRDQTCFDGSNGHEIQNFINNGAFGSVHSAIKKVAIKSLKKDFQQMANNEFRMLRKCEIFESKTEVKIVLELLKMDLAQFKDMYGKFGHRNLRMIAYGILNALDYLYLQSVIHRDIKKKNVLLSQNDQVTDFGLSCTVNFSEKLTTFAGTLLFSSPEMRKIHSPNTVPKEIKPSYDE